MGATLLGDQDLGEVITTRSGTCLTLTSAHWTIATMAPDLMWIRWEQSQS